MLALRTDTCGHEQIECTYNHDDAPSKDNESQKEAGADFPDGHGGWRLADGVRKEEHKGDNGVCVVDAVHFELLLHAAVRRQHITVRV